MEIDLRNLLRILEHLGWTISGKESGFLVYTNRKKRPNRLYVPETAITIHDRGINELLLTVSYLLNSPVDNLKAVLSSKNVYEMSDRQLRALLSDIENNYESFKVYSGTSGLYDSVYVVVTFGKSDAKYYYEYFAFLLLDDMVHTRSSRTRFGDDLVGFIGQDPILFSLSDAMQQAHGALQSLFLAALDDEKWIKTSDEIQLASDLKEIGFEHFVRILLLKPKVIAELQKSINGELRKRLDATRRITGFETEEI